MIKRGELTDEAWAWVEPLLPEGGRRDGRWREHRTVTNGILWKLRTGAPWEGPARALRPLADLLRSVRALAARRHLGAPAGPRADQVGRGWEDRVGGERRLDSGARPSARCRRTQGARAVGTKKGAAERARRGVGAQ